MNIMNVGLFTFGRQLIGIFGQLRVEINLLCQPTPTTGKYKKKKGGGGGDYKRTVPFAKSRK